MQDDNPATTQLGNLAELLSIVLEKEFEALQARDIEVLEGTQSEKVLLLNQIADGWSLLQDEKNAESSNNNDAHLREILISCKRKHVRNDIMLRRQIEEVKSILNTLTMQTKSHTQEVYNKLGKLID
jgi:flagellar biosynthesis/type III secretory pathway chaperone